MALSTFTELKDAIASWMARDDLSGPLSDFVTLAESRINRVLRVREMVSNESGTLSGPDIELPPGFIETLKLTLGTESGLPLEYRPNEDAGYRVAANSTGEPRIFSVLGANLVLAPQPDSTYTFSLDYYAKVPALSDTNSTNWLLAKAPDVYLFGGLKEAAGFLMEMEAESYWDAKFQEAVMALHTAEARTKRTSGPNRARVLV